MLHIRRTLIGVGYLGIAVALVTGVNPILAVAHPPPTNAAHQTYTDPQPPSKADFSGHGANTHGPYDSTRSGAPSLNGNGKGKAVGKPCAGCVGKADNKNPKGQMPNGSDANAGYECDRNHGIGRTNPAHTGCVATTPSTPPSTPVSTPPTSPVSTPPTSPVSPPPTSPVSTPPTTQATSVGSTPPTSPGSTPPTGASSSSSGPPTGSSGPGGSTSPVPSSGQQTVPLGAPASGASRSPASGASILSSTGTVVRGVLLAALALIVLGGAVLMLGRTRRPAGKHLHH